MLVELPVHTFGAVKKGMSRVVFLVPVRKIDIGGEQFGFDDQEPARFEALVELVKLSLWIVKMFGHFATDDKIIGRGYSFRVWDEIGVVSGHGVSLFQE